MKNVRILMAVISLILILVPKAKADDVLESLPLMDQNKLISLLDSIIIDENREVSVWGGFNEYLWPASFFDKEAGSFGIEIPVAQIALRPKKEWLVDWTVGFQRLGRHGTDLYDGKNTAEWVAPISGLYFGPRFDLGDFYCYSFGSINSMSDIMLGQLKDKVAINGTNYDLTSLAMGLDVGLGFSIPLAKEVSLDSDAAFQYLEFNDYNVAGTLPSGFNPPHTLSYSGLNLTFSITFYPNEAKVIKDKCAAARKQLQDMSAKFDNDSFIASIQNHDTTLMTLYLTAGMDKKEVVKNFAIEKLKENGIGSDLAALKERINRNDFTAVDWILTAGLSEKDLKGHDLDSDFEDASSGMKKMYAKRKLSQYDIEFSHEQFKKKIDQCDLNVVSWFLNAGIKVEKDDFSKACDELKEIYKKFLEKNSASKPEPAKHSKRPKKES